MAKSRDHVETSLEEFREKIIAGVTSLGASSETWTSQQSTPIPGALTPQEQTRALFDIVKEGTSQSKVSLDQICSHVEPELRADLEQQEQNSTMVVTMKTNWETIKRQRQLTCQVMDEIEQHWAEIQKERNEIGYLKTKTEQQQEHATGNAQRPKEDGKEQGRGQKILGQADFHECSDQHMDIDRICNQKDFFSEYV
ncbi:golgin subfamily B member 1-like protein [Lates japonicus]|uniref:Golgin subfamily B member 1-like protein n=1 Tax=Lates japonicus TaxID=270547 RepID=A0AAD3M521_LATJO|nr:golgin subfamily B member 1-like protein [Lates japonicus]